MNSPILLESQAVLDPNATQGVVDETALKNPFKTAMLIDEVRVNVPVGLGDMQNLRLKLTMGRIPLTNGFIFVPTLGKLLNPTEDPYHLTWKFPKPLYIPRGEYLVPTFFNDPRISSATITANIAYAGRSLGSDAPVPAKANMPWATSFVGTSRATGSGAIFTEHSMEGDLVNPFDTEMNIQRFVGRILTDQPGPSNPANYRDTLVQMVDAVNRILVRDSTPFSEVFSALDHTWTVNTKLAAKGFFLVNLVQDYSSIATFTPLGAERAVECTIINPVITMIGHREVALQ